MLSIFPCRFQMAQKCSQPVFFHIFKDAAHALDPLFNGTAMHYRILCNSPISRLLRNHRICFGWIARASFVCILMFRQLCDRFGINGVLCRLAQIDDKNTIKLTQQMRSISVYFYPHLYFCLFVYLFSTASLFIDRNYFISGKKKKVLYVKRYFAYKNNKQQTMRSQIDAY